MLEKKLQEFWNTGKFATSWIIVTPYIDQALAEISLFAQGVLSVPNLPLDNNPDFRIIKRGLNSSNNEAKYIGVDKIREVQSFLNSTSAVSERKIAVIYEADLMNINSSNCCLKILEEAPRDSYLFLITSYPGNILPTIKSRCHKLNLWDEISSFNGSSLTDDGYIKFVRMLQSSSSIEKLKYIQEVTAKDSSDLWSQFCSHAMKYLEDTLKYSVSSREGNVGLNLQKLESVQNLRDDARNFDLDKRQMGILILECLR
ncbi:MAG: hypothetical protein RLZZ59_193 [Pseudomonadota bacterium]|jgi:DNA polymerase-3 subunit delta'